MMVDIRIGDLKDADKPVFPELEGKPFKEIEIKGAAILQAGMTSGKPSVFLHGFDGETTVGFQLSADMLGAIFAALNGAMTRWSK